MQRLPDFLMLDFCEWIKRVILSKAQYSNIDMWDLLFDEKYEKLLLKKAKEYCNKERKQKNAYSNDNIKKIINESIRMYYESDEFQDLCYSIRRLKEHYSRDYLFHEFQRSFTHFGYFLINEMPRYFNEINDYDEQHLSPYTLIDNLRYCYKDSLRNDQEKNPILELMVGSKAVEIEFLEWIEQENIGKEVVEKIDLMPVDVFEEYAFRFCEDTGNGGAVKRRLVKSFKRSDPGNLLNEKSNPPAMLGRIE